MLLNLICYIQRISWYINCRYLQAGEGYCIFVLWLQIILKFVKHATPCATSLSNILSNISPTTDEIAFAMASSNVASSNIHHFRKRINISLTLVSESYVRLYCEKNVICNSSMKICLHQIYIIFWWRITKKSLNVSNLSWDMSSSDVSDNSLQLSRSVILISQANMILQILLGTILYFTFLFTLFVFVSMPVHYSILTKILHWTKKLKPLNLPITCCFWVRLHVWCILVLCLVLKGCVCLKLNFNGNTLYLDFHFSTIFMIVLVFVLKMSI